MIDSERLQKGRQRAALTQNQVASSIGVPREMISMWENGSRTPSQEILQRLAELYRVPPSYLKGKGAKSELSKRKVLFRGGPSSNPEVSQKARQEVKRWTRFLDNWASFLSGMDEVDPDEISPDRPPQEIDEGFGITDSRRASTLAKKVRNHYDLGQDAIPDLYSFLDEAGVLVYKVALDPVSSSREVASGAFYNHPQVGYSILVNIHCSEGRQAFTLAHEFAHALFHYQEQALVSIGTDRQPRERFANAFAAYFLVPARKLRSLCRRERERRDELSPYSALRFAAYFRVSYLMMLFRLHEERQISKEKVEEWQEYSPIAMARKIGLDTDFLMSPRRPRFEPSDDELSRYPVSVIERIRKALVDDRLSASEAADILQIDCSPNELRQQLLELPRRTEEDKEDLNEYPIRWRSI